MTKEKKYKISKRKFVAAVIGVTVLTTATIGVVSLAQSKTENEPNTSSYTISDYQRKIEFRKILGTDTLNKTFENSGVPYKTEEQLYPKGYANMNGILPGTEPDYKEPVPKYYPAVTPSKEEIDALKSANPNAEYFLINEGSNQYVMYVVQDLTTEECINIIQNLKDTGEIPENSEVTVTGDSNQYNYATIDPKGKTK